MIFILILILVQVLELTLTLHFLLTSVRECFFFRHFLSFYGYIMDSLYSWTSSSSPTYSLMFTLCQILYESSGYFAFVVIQLMILILLINNSREIISLNLIILFSKIITKLFSVSSTKLCYLIVT